VDSLVLRTTLLPFSQDGLCSIFTAGEDTGAASETGNDGEISLLDVFTKYDAPWPSTKLFVWVFGDQFVMEYDFLGTGLLLAPGILPVQADEAADITGGYVLLGSLCNGNDEVDTIGCVDMFVIE
jgi:hypothetical protein